MFRRELLCVTRASYVFIGRRCARPQRMLLSIRRELRWMMRSLRLIRVELALPCSPEVITVDAPEWGGGACRATARTEIVAYAADVASDAVSKTERR